jgi:hypothetical protein
MVFAVAVLMMQTYAVPAPRVAAETPTPTASLEDGTKPNTTKSDSAPAAAPHAASTDANAGETGHAHLNLSNVKLNDGNSSGSEPTLTAVSLTDPQKQGLSTVRIPEPDSIRPLPISPVNAIPSKRQWLVLTVFQHSAAAFDAYTTRQAIGRGAVEEDPTMRPFAHSPALYAAIQAGPVLFDLLARRMQRSENPMFRRTWWLPQSIATAAFLSSGIHNTGVRGRQ